MEVICTCGFRVDFRLEQPGETVRCPKCNSWIEPHPPAVREPLLVAEVVAPNRAESFECPQCQGNQTQSVPAIFSSGTWSGTSRAGGGGGSSRENGNEYSNHEYLHFKTSRGFSARHTHCDHAFRDSIARPAADRNQSHAVSIAAEHAK